MLAFFKYWGFFVESAASVLGPDQPIPFVEVILPVGISFYTFQALSYVVDVHRREVDAAPLLDVAVYLSFFPQLVAGPIVRAKEFLPQLRRQQVGGRVCTLDARHPKVGNEDLVILRPQQDVLWLQPVR